MPAETTSFLPLPTPATPGDDAKLRAIFDSFSGGSARLSRDGMLEVICATQDVSRTVAASQVDLSLQAMGEYAVLGDYINAAGVTFEGFKLAYTQFAETSVDEDYFLLEAFGLLSAAATAGGNDSSDE
ncbi:uncharacterized protein AMSG_04184 [Thecamonas trahens ATCC 50062]|uniref:Uncharacterized protein n=1 Tax=Thecamonas trahens ATCC 50062 TaxID=461836 RepID=A0A0L0D6V9_THETB|nr:hypothetical protein AMSG_04184 [Thecamonas trahens ATCC 50062]KNC47950.1 hypothetical protein AMSG_04184 [Thecamonas trahens ATCC 50062]|eukprot:XP_013758967.1 hypothetical protein AMSG_04184 [Thecamonas trahens ATCC 50062]